MYSRCGTILQNTVEKQRCTKTDVFTWGGGCFSTANLMVLGREEDDKGFGFWRRDLSATKCSSFHCCTPSFI